MPFAPIGSERYGRKNIFAVIEFAKPEAAGFWACKRFKLLVPIFSFSKFSLDKPKWGGGNNIG